MSASPDRWLALSIPVSNEDEAALITQVLLEYGCRGAEQNGNMLLAHFFPPSDPDAFAAELIRVLGEEAHAEIPSIDWEWQAQEDWEEFWKKGLAPRRIGDRLVVSPSWCTPELEDSDILITVDPKMAFGTAEHATTRGCLRLLESCVDAGQKIADIGSGSGILAIAAVKLGAERVFAIESDPLATGAAEENLQLNGVVEQVRLQESVATPELLAGLGPMDGVVANIQPEILLALLPGFRSLTKLGGWLILSGIPVAEGGKVVGAAIAMGYTPAGEDREDGWTSLRFRRLPIGRGLVG